MAKQKWENVATSGLAPFVKFSVGKTIEGKVLGIKTFTQNGKGKEKDKKRQLLEIVDAKTGEISAIGEYAGLSNLFKIARKGNDVRITCIGKRKIPTRPQPMLQFKVQIAR